MIEARHFILMAMMLPLLGCAGKGSGHENTKAEATMSEDSTYRIVVTSGAFKEGEMIPSKFTCDGPDISPPLSWAAPPELTKSLAIIADDPDAPMGTWVHWVIFNIPANTRGLEESVPPSDSLPDGSRQGKNDFRKYGYGGPCPPRGTHRYYFKLYALDTMLALRPGCSSSELLKAMDGHIVGRGVLMGKYSH